VSARLRRSTRAATLATEHMLEADAAAGVASATGTRRGRRKAAEEAAPTRSVSERRAGRSRTRGQAGEAEETAATAASTGRRGRHARGAAASSASPSRARETTPVRRGAKLVKVVQRKRKSTAHEEAEEAEEATPAASPASSAAAAAAPSPSPAAAAAAVLRSAPPVFFHPSSPSVLATLVLRDLNGECEVRLELDDPVLGHVNSDRAVGSVTANCDTPAKAARIFLGLARVLPASTFTPAAWTAFMQRASTVSEELLQQTAADAAAEAEGAAGAGAAVRRKRGGKGAAAAAAAAATPTPVDPSLMIRAAVAQLHRTVLSTLAPLRLLCNAQLTRTTFTQTNINLTGIMRAE